MSLERWSPSAGTGSRKKLASGIGIAEKFSQQKRPHCLHCGFLKGIRVKAIEWFDFRLDEAVIDSWAGVSCGLDVHWL